VPTPTPTPDPRLALDAWESFPVYDPEEALTMSGWMNDGAGLVEDGVYYGRFFMAGKRGGVTIALPLRENGTDIRAGVWRVLDETCSSRCLQKAGDTLFYVKDYGSESRGEGGLVRVNTDGSGYRLLYEGSCGCLNLRGDRLFFTDGENRLISTDLDGGDRQVILDKAVFYAYFLSQDWLLFQDDADNESLHLLHFPSGAELKLNDEQSYRPILAGRQLFYMIYEKERDSYRLCRVDLSAWEMATDLASGDLFPVFTAEHGGGLFHGTLFTDGETLWPDTGYYALPAEAWASEWGDLEGNDGYVLRFLSGDYAVIDGLSPSGGVNGVFVENRRTGVSSQIPWVR